MNQRIHSEPRLSCVIPAYNEAASLPAVVAEVLAAVERLTPQLELILVDDGSRDDTAAVAARLCAQDARVRLVRLSRNFGKEAALSAGLAATRGDVVVMLDADGQHPPALIADMLARWRQGDDVVYAVRATRSDQPALYQRLAALFYGLVNRGNRVPIPRDAGDFRLLDRRAVNALLALPERHRFMKGLYAWIGFRSHAIDYEPRARLAGQSHYGLRGALRLGVTGLLAFTAMPLRLLGLVGIVLALAAVLFGLWVVFEYFWYGIKVPGYATVVVGLMFLSGVQLMSIGLLSEYVARIYDEVKQRPLYLVAEELGQGLAPQPEATQPAPAAQRVAASGVPAPGAR